MEDHFYNFNNIFTLKSNTSYFESMFHAFRALPSSFGNKAGGEQPSVAPLSFEFKLDPALKIETKGKQRVNLMLYNNREDDCIEFCYPWFRPINAKLEFPENSFRFTFNKDYMRFSNIVAEGWELIDIFRSILIASLVRNKKYMLHSAAVSRAGEGLLLPAWGNTGKTSTSWMLSKSGWEFLTDEFAIIDSEGYCYGLPCSSLMSGKTASKFGARLGTMDKAKLFFSDAKSKILSSRFAPGGIKIYPDQLLNFCKRAKITQLAIIENGPESFRSIDKHEALVKIQSIQDYEFGWKSNPFLLARSFFSGFDLNALASIEYSFLEEFLSNLKEIRVVSSSSGEHYKSFLGTTLIKARTEDLVSLNQ